jgi:hypothetical protein
MTSYPTEDQPGVHERATCTTCPVCWKAPFMGHCQPEGSHLGRYQRAQRRGVITREELAAVAAAATDDRAHRIVPLGGAS